MLNYTLPFPPSGNKRLGRSKKNKCYLTASVRAYFDSVKIFSRHQHKLKIPIEDKLKIDVTFIMPDKKIRDLDNAEKVFYDSLMFAGIIKDDSQIYEKHVRKSTLENGELEVKKYGEVILKIEPLII